VSAALAAFWQTTPREDVSDEELRSGDVGGGEPVERLREPGGED
jgi:hypothetical protein